MTAPSGTFTPLNGPDLGFVIVLNEETLASLTLGMFFRLQGLRNIGRFYRVGGTIEIHLAPNPKIQQRSVLLGLTTKVKRILRAANGPDMIIDDSAMPEPHRRPERKRLEPPYGIPGGIKAWR